QFYIGNSPITIRGDDVTVGDKTYKGTPGLWELLTMAKPNNSIYNDTDIESYARILDETNAIRSTTNPNKPKSSRSEGVSSVILPSNPNVLVEMLSLRLAGYKAGNTGAANEAVAICDELLRQGALNKDSYKAIMLQLARE
ncbi:predicted protein, partial [Nematostella vectensis]